MEPAVCVGLGHLGEKDCDLVQKMIKEDAKLNAVITQIGTPGISALVLKGRVRETNGDYFSALLYYSLALWYECIMSKSTSSQNNLRSLVNNARLLYEQQLKKASTTTDETLEWIPSRPSNKDMIDSAGQQINFRTLVGLTIEKEKMRNKFTYPLMYPQLYGGKDVNNILLYGPPGTGKTMLARAASSAIQDESVINNQGREVPTVYTYFYNVAADTLRSKWEGGTEKKIAELFDTAEKGAVKLREIVEAELKAAGIPNHKFNTLSVIFLDEVESIASSRDTGDSSSGRAITTLLQQMGGFRERKNVAVIAATNYPWKLDNAFLRRFSSRIFVNLSDQVDRFSLITTNVYKLLIGINPSLICSVRVNDDDGRGGGDDEFTNEFTKFKRDWFPRDGMTTILKICPRFTQNEKFVAVPISREKDKVITTYIPSDDDYKTMVLDRISFIAQFNPELYKRLLVDIENGDYRNPFNMRDVLKSFATDTEGYLYRLITNLIETSHGETPLVPLVNKISILENYTTNYEKITEPLLIMLFFVAMYLGPNTTAYRARYVQQRSTYHYTSSIFGLSSSDITNVVNEFASINAYNILHKKYKPINCGGIRTREEECYPTELKECFRVAEDGTRQFISIVQPGRIPSDILIVNGGDKGDVDIYSNIKLHDWFVASQTYKTTIGNSKTYCDVVGYSQQDEENILSTVCMSDINDVK